MWPDIVALAQDGVLEVSLLKRSRRGCYAAGETNADTFFRSVVRQGPPGMELPPGPVPTAYYFSYSEDGDKKERAEIRAARLVSR